MEITEDLIEQHANEPAKLRLEIAVLMYDHEVWSLRKAASFAGIFWDDFSGILKERNITTGMLTVEDFENDLKAIEHYMLSQK